MRRKLLGGRGFEGSGVRVMKEAGSNTGSKSGSISKRPVQLPRLLQTAPCRELKSAVADPSNSIPLTPPDRPSR